MRLGVGGASPDGRAEEARLKNSESRKRSNCAGCSMNSFQETAGKDGELNRT